MAATVTAMSSLEGDKVMILGGKGKGEDYAPLAEAVLKYAKGAVLLGEEKEKIALALDGAGFNNYSMVSTMEEAVEAASRIAAPGDTVLLSPACTSWDMYPNYGARGDHFCSIVKGIIEIHRPCLLRKRFGRIRGVTGSTRSLGHPAHTERDRDPYDHVHNRRTPSPYRDPVSDGIKQAQWLLIALRGCSWSFSAAFLENDERPDTYPDMVYELASAHPRRRCERRRNQPLDKCSWFVYIHTAGRAALPCHGTAPCQTA